MPEIRQHYASVAFYIARLSLTYKATVKDAVFITFIKVSIRALSFPDILIDWSL
jgi:hypothetical protein